MAGQRNAGYHTHDPFAALGSYHIQHLEDAIQDHLDARAVRPAHRRSVVAAARRVWTWLRRGRITALWSARRRLA